MYRFTILLFTSFLISGYRSDGQQADTLQIDSKDFVAVEEEASYPGGNAAWIKFLEKNLKADIPVKNDAPMGKYTAMVVFIVDKDGSISNIKPLTNFGYGIEEEVIRVLERSGKWIPANQNGKPLKAYRKQPITFIINNENFEISTSTPYTLYTNTDNEVTVSAGKVKAADISIIIPGAKVTRLADGEFSVRLSKPGRVTMQIVNSKKDDKEIGLASFEVKTK